MSGLLFPWLRRHVPAGLSSRSGGAEDGLLRKGALAVPANRANTGSFQKGQSGNPSGRPKKTKQQKDALEAIRQLAPNAAEVLREMLDPSSHTPPQVRIKAVELVLDRAYGKPQQSVSIDTPKAQALDDIRAELDAMRGDMHD